MPAVLSIIVGPELMLVSLSRDVAFLCIPTVPPFRAVALSMLPFRKHS